MIPRIPTGRAATPEEKKAILDRLLTAWLRSPELRLGQLLDNSLDFAPTPHADLFGIEDEPLLAMVEKHIEPGEVQPTAKLTLPRREDGARIVDRPREAQGAPAGCGCYACAGKPIMRTRMYLCGTCGNKRCPKATDHRNACTVSNEAGQPGSNYE